MTGEAITFMLPLPARELNPNARVDRRRRAVCIEQARRDTFYLIRAQLAAQGRTTRNWGICDAVVQIVYPNRIRRDTSNTFAAMKAAWDAITDVGIWKDDEHVVWHIALPRVDRDHCGVSITIRPIEEV